MKSFILLINKYKKWIVLGLSIFMLILFFFPLMPTSKDDTIRYIIPWFIGMIMSLFNTIQAIPLVTGNMKDLYIHIFTNSLFAVVFFIAWLIVSILCIIFTFKGKRFYFCWSLILFFLCDLIKSVTIDYNEVVIIGFNMWYTFIFSLILLILDIIYLALEYKYIYQPHKIKSINEYTKTS